MEFFTPRMGEWVDGEQREIHSKKGYLLTSQELDRNEEPKTKVRVQITLPNVKTYQAHADDIKALAARAGGTVAVKMA